MNLQNNTPMHSPAIQVKPAAPKSHCREQMPGDCDPSATADSAEAEAKRGERSALVQALIEAVHAAGIGRAGLDTTYFVLRQRLHGERRAGVKWIRQQAKVSKSTADRHLARLSRAGAVAEGEIAPPRLGLIAGRRRRQGGRTAITTLAKAGLVEACKRFQTAPSVPLARRVVYALIADRVWTGEQSGLRISIKDLAGRVGASERKVGGAIQTLKKAGLLRVEPGRLYRLAVLDFGASKPALSEASAPALSEASAPDLSEASLRGNPLQGETHCRGKPGGEVFRAEKIGADTDDRRECIREAGCSCDWHRGVAKLAHATLDVITTLQAIDYLGIVAPHLWELKGVRSLDKLLGAYGPASEPARTVTARLRAIIRAETKRGEAIRTWDYFKPALDDMAASGGAPQPRPDTRTEWQRRPFGGRKADPSAVNEMLDTTRGGYDNWV